MLPTTQIELNTIMTTFTFPDYDATPSLREFLRAELSCVTSFDGPHSDIWNASSISRSIRESADLGYSIGEDAITRFLDPDNPIKTQKRNLMAIAAFLLVNEFVTTDDLEHYSKRDYSRPASVLAQLFSAGRARTDRTLAKELVGEYRFYQSYGRERLVETVIVIASPDDGRSLTVKETRAVYVLDDLEALVADTDNLSFNNYWVVRETLDDNLASKQEGFKAHGAGIATDQHLAFLLGGEEQISYGILTVDDVSVDARNRINGLKGSRLPHWIRSVDGEIDTTRPRSHMNRVLADLFSRFIFYPQRIDATGAPKFASAGDIAKDWKPRDSGLNLMGSPGMDMDELEQWKLEADRVEIEIELALDRCANETERLAVAIELMRVDYAIKAVQNGADVKAEHPTYGLPMIHTAAAHGMRELVRAILEIGKYDLTVRDRFGRLASTCADNCAEDGTLRDELIVAQTAQFREKGIDPRRPNVPGYGSYTLS